MLNLSPVLPVLLTGTVFSPCCLVFLGIKCLKVCVEFFHNKLLHVKFVSYTALPVNDAYETFVEERF